MQNLSLILNKNTNKQQGEMLSSKSFFQPKLTLNQPNDVYEQEADAMADKVMRMPDPTVSNNFFFKPAISSLQRKCAQCDEEEKTAQRKETNNEEIAASHQTENYISTLSGGRALNENERHFFEPRMGYDFGNVRIHTDVGANASAKNINALAYTNGNNIVFGEAQYQPETDAGKKLIAHELVHVVQQNNKIGRKIQRFTSSCRSLLNNPVGSLGRVLSGTAIHMALQEDFALNVVGGVAGFGIPGASASSLRTAGLCGEDLPVIVPQIIGGRAGMGFPDLARRDGTILEVAEIKPASWGCAVDGVAQLAGYITQGNATDPQQLAWRAARGIVALIPMSPATYPGRTITIGAYTLITEWCSPGLLVYQVIGSNVPIPIPVPARAPETSPSPVLVREHTTWEIIRDFAEQAIRTGQTSKEVIENFLRAHPGLINLIIAAGITGLIATFAEDIATLGAGILDDLVTVPFFARMISIALELRQSLAIAATAATVKATH